MLSQRSILYIIALMSVRYLDEIPILLILSILGPTEKCPRSRWENIFNACNQECVVVPTCVYFGQIYCLNRDGGREGDLNPLSAVSAQAGKQ